VARHEGSAAVVERAMTPFTYGRTLLAIAVSMASILVIATPAAAECNPAGADPSFRKAAPFATRILAGTVVAVASDDLNPTGGESYRFTVAIERTLRGPQTTTLVVDRIETGACVRWLSAAVGDRVALALDARVSDPSIPTNIAAWIDGVPRESSPYERLTLTEVVDLARGPQMPDTSTGPTASVVALAVLGRWLTLDQYERYSAQR
jgi:hypothetical protein